MRKGDLTRERIVSRAIELASTDGIGGVTLGRLADATGMSKSGLFAHFRSKEELQLQILEAAIASFRTEVVEPAMATPTGEDRFRRVFERWIGWAQTSSRMPGGCLFTQAAAELDDQPGPVRDVLADAERRWHETLSAFARSAIRAGAFRADLDPGLFAFQLKGIFLGMVNSQRLLEDPQAHAYARGAFDALLDWARSKP